MLLIVSSAASLAKRYGTAGASKLREHMEALQLNLTAFAATVTTILPDDSGSVARLGLRAMSMSSPPAVLQAIWAVSDAIGLSSEDALLLLGGNEVVPFAVMPNPAAGGVDPDATILSDNPYGFLASRAAEAFQAGAVPDFAVGRLPDFEPASLDGFLALLDTLVSPSRGARNGTFAVVNEAWFSPTVRILGGDVTIRTTPPWSALNAEWKTQDAQVLYFNLHGFDNASAWRGFDETSGNWRDAVKPSDIAPEAVSGAIVFAENCYGGLVVGRSNTNSIALSMLAAGVRVFVGSTGMAYGSFMQQPYTPIDADVLGGDFVQGVRAGATAGYALVSARRRLAASTDPGGWSADRQKTISEFVLYGNPLAMI